MAEKAKSVNLLEELHLQRFALDDCQYSRAVIQSNGLRVTHRSKDDLYSELHIECLSRTDPRSAIEVTNGVTDQAESTV